MIVPPATTLAPDRRRMLPRPTRRQMLTGGVAVALAASSGAVVGAAPAPDATGGRIVPARPLPVPDTVSPELQARIAPGLPAGWDTIPGDAAAWRKLAAESAAEVAPVLPKLRNSLGLSVEKGVIAGVPVFTITPANLPSANRNRLLMHLHGGGYVLFPGEAGAGEGMLMAGYGGFKVVSVDFRMLPDHPFPAPLDDATAVWRALVAEHDPRTMGVFGTSSGGGLTLALMLRLKAEGLPLPAAIGPGSPWADLTGNGNSAMANALVDNVLVSNTGWVGTAATLYAAGHDIRDPQISPIFGDFRGLPPAILTSGTRDLFLSNTVRSYRKLRQAGVDAALQVFEAQSHAQFLNSFVPETEEAMKEIAGFLAARLAG